MDNIFLKYPDFISLDPRQHRQRYRITPEFQFVRHNMTMKPSDIKGARVLDLGCCVGATGAWALHYGADRYVGVDLQSEFCSSAKQSLTKYFPTHNWEIVEQSFSEFFETVQESFDIVVAFGIVYQSIYFEKLIDNIVQLNPTTIIVDSIHPQQVETVLKNNNITDPVVINQIRNLALIEYKNHMMVSDIPNNNIKIDSALPSLKALQVIMAAKNYALTQEIGSELESLFPGSYVNRYCPTFTKSADVSKIMDFESTYSNHHKENLIPYGAHGTTSTWEFNSTVAEVFENHARQHIPDYDRVIDQAVSIAGKLLTADSRIIDVGSATGETIRRLNVAGFRNLTGVEASHAMLKKCDHDLAKYIHSDRFPRNKYDAVLCNWTLHFISDKTQYLSDIFQGIDAGGFLILTDKTCNSGIELDLYHNFKRKQGVSESDIMAKANSVKDIMFIDSPEWYLTQLKNLGFASVSIINSAPCFTTFLACKAPT